MRMTMKKTLLASVAALALSLGLSFVSPAAACPGCDCPHKKEAQAAQTKAGKAKTQEVSLEGKVQGYGCPIEAEKQECTGAVLVVGEKKHFIKKADKGTELVQKAKGSDKLVK